MERLNERDSQVDVYVKQHDYVTASKKLCEYEELEEKGLLLKLPCKVGDTVYTLHKNIVKEEKVYDVQYRGIKYQQGQRWFMNIGASVYFEMDFGKTVFLTQEQAEEALKKMRETEENT